MSDFTKEERAKAAQLFEGVADKVYKSEEFSEDDKAAMRVVAEYSVSWSTRGDRQVGSETRNQVKLHFISDGAGREKRLNMQLQAESTDARLGNWRMLSQSLSVNIENSSGWIECR